MSTPSDGEATPLGGPGEDVAGLLPPPGQTTAFSHGGQGSVAAEHPELLAAGAFAGGLLAAMILKRLGH